MRARWQFLPLALKSFVAVHLLLSSATQATPLAIADCAAALAPQIKVLTLDERTRYAWLNLISEKTYESAKSEIKASGDVKLLDLVKVGDAEASYDQFSEKRREFLRINKGEYNHDLALNIFTQSLPGEAYTSWMRCVDNVTRTPGLFAWFQEDTRGSAVLYVRYYEGPGRTTTAIVSLDGAKEKRFSIKLEHDSTWNTLITRKAGKDIVAGVTDHRYSDHAASAVPVRNDTGLIVQPYVLTSLAATPCAANPCELCIDRAVVTVEAPDAQHLDATLLVDSPDKRSLPQAPQRFRDERQLDDVALSTAGTVQVVIAGQVGQIATLIPYSGCRTPVMRLRNSRVVVVKPPPIIQTVVTGPLTQDITLRRYGDFKVFEGNIGCPHCHESWIAEIVVREAGLPVTIDRFEKIEVVSEQQTGHWYSCTDGVCGVEHPDYTQHPGKASPSCIGTNSCWVWRHGDDSHQATQTFRVTYYKKEQKCVKNCPSP